MKTSQLKYGLLAIGLLGIIVCSYLFSGNDASNAAAVKCLNKPSELIAQTRARGNLYSLHRISEPLHLGARELLVMSQSSGICAVLNDEADGIIYPLNNYTSDDVASELNKQKVGMMVADAGGKEKFEKLLNSELKKVSKSKLYMPSDVYGALESLGIDIPKQYVSVNEPPPFQELKLETN